MPDVPAISSTLTNIARSGPAPTEKGGVEPAANMYLAAKSKELPNYIVFVEPGKPDRLFDLFILSSYKKSYEEIVQPSFTRGQPILEVFSKGLTQVQVELQFVESSAPNDTSANQVQGQSLKVFLEEYSQRLRASMSAKKGAFVILCVKGRKDFGYITTLGFDRSSATDHMVRASIGMWVFDQQDSGVGREQARLLLAAAASGSEVRSPAAFYPEPDSTIPVSAILSRSQYGAHFADNGREVEHVRLEIFDATRKNKLFRYDEMIVAQVSDIDSEKAQLEVSSHGLNKGWFYNRNLKVLSVSFVLMDLQPGETDGPGNIHAQLETFEYLYRRYLRGSQAVFNRLRIELHVRGDIYVGFLTHLSIGLASDSDTIATVAFSFMVTEHTVLAPKAPTVMDGDKDLGPAHFSKETLAAVLPTTSKPGLIGPSTSPVVNKSTEVRV